MTKVFYEPKENVEYTFRRLNRTTGKPVFETYQFYGEITESGRYVLFEINKHYSTSVTVAHFSYRMRKEFVRQKDLTTGITYYTASRRTVKRVANTKTVKKENTEEFIEKMQRTVSVYPQYLFDQITAQTGIERDEYLDELESYKKIPAGPIKDSVLKSIKVKWNKLLKVTFNPTIGPKNI